MRLSMLDMRLGILCVSVYAFALEICVGVCYAFGGCVCVIVRSILRNVRSNRRFSHKTTLSHCIQRFCQFLLDFPCQI